ncbi:hypothetical protein [Endozoicomonas sp. 4G]|uniref:hypothetical protein n=1 Tax=Endozoicomonas sp. 4G TaxID=2872754 RepID=UPI002078984A|nr:hypothetical protein [Endozoicomonas sp. 4G]
MLSKTTLILILAIAFSVHCSNGQTQENSLPLLFALAADKALFNTSGSFIEVSTVKAIVTEIQQGENQQREINAIAKQRGSLMLARFRGDKKPEQPAEEGIEEEGEAIEWWELNQEPETNDSDMLRVCFGGDILLKLKPDTRYCFSPATGVSPATGASPDPDVEHQAYRRAASDDSAYSEDSSSEDSDTSDENSDNRSDQEGDADSDVQYATTTLHPFPVSNEINRYCTTLVLKKIKQEPVSDSEIATDSEVDATEVDSVNHLDISLLAYSTDQTHLPANQRLKVYQCDHEGCSYSTDRAGNLKRHKQRHLPAEQRPERPKVFQCDHKGCNHRTNYSGNLKTHKLTHLTADQRARILERASRPRRKVHRCDHEGCNYSTGQTSNLKYHKQTHLPAEQRLKMQCDHEGCNYSTDRLGNLKTHKKTHLPADQRPERLKVHQCDHEGCKYSTDLASNLRRHKEIHLPADQRPKRPKRPRRPKLHQCDHQDCDYRTDLVCNLRRHKKIHLPADQRPERPKITKRPKKPRNLKWQECDHQGCNYGTCHGGNLKMHKQTHLPANQRVKKLKCDHKGCNYRTDRMGNLKAHKQTHLPQRNLRPSRF